MHDVRRKIHAGEYYYSERGKNDGDFFNRNLHTYCHNMECEYCSDIDNEFSWDSITDYVQEKYCGECQHAARKDDRDDWEECQYRRIVDCPKILKIFED